MDFDLKWRQCAICSSFRNGIVFCPVYQSGWRPEVAAFYRQNFKPSTELKQPKVNVDIFAFCSEDEQKIVDWITEFDYRMLPIEAGATDELPSFEDIKNRSHTLQQKARIAYNKGRYTAGTPKKLKAAIEKIADEYETDEIMIATIPENFEDQKNPTNCWQSNS